MVSAAAAAGISRQTAFYHKANDIEFRTRWEKAIEVFLDALLDEAYRRAAIGYDEPVIHQGRLATTADPTTGEERPLAVRKHSDRLLEVLLKFRYGEQMADRLAERAEAADVRSYSDYFDDAARLAGVPYCRALDLYVDRETKLRADRLGYGQAHLALC